MITIPIKLHCSVTETDHDDFVSWTSDFLCESPRRHRLYTSESDLRAAIDAEITEIKAAHPTITEISFSFTVTRSRTPFPEGW